MRIGRLRSSFLPTLLALALVAPAAARADAPPSIGPDGISADSDNDIGQLLGPVYKDNVSGFQVAPPAGSRIINRAGLELVTFVNDARQWGGSVELANLKQKTNIEDFVNSIPPQLAKTFRAVQTLDTRMLKFNGKNAARLETSMQAELGQGQKGAPGELIALYRQQMIVQTTDAAFLVLTLYTPLKDRDDAKKTFETMLTTFKVMSRDEVAKHLETTVKAGKEWLAQRTAQELLGKLNNQPQLFRMKVAGQDMGYFRFDESGAAEGKDKGVTLTINSRGFPANGSINYGRIVAFWALAPEGLPADSRPLYSTWEKTTKTSMFRPNDPRPQQFWIRELGTLQLELPRYSSQEIEDMRKHREDVIRNGGKVPPPIDIPPKQYRIQVSFTADASQPPVKGLDTHITLDHPSPLPAILEYLWPRVTDLSKPTEMTFVVYNDSPDVRKLTYRTFSVIGPDRIVIDKQPTNCIRCLDEMDANSTTIWVDQNGKMLMMRTSDQSLFVPTTEDEMARLWAGKLKEQ